MRLFLAEPQDHVTITPGKGPKEFIVSITGAKGVEVDMLVKVNKGSVMIRRGMFEDIRRLG
jgi:hypothetical protein